MRLEWLLHRLLGLTVAVWAYKAAVKWWDEHPPQRGRRADLPTLATFVFIRFGLTTAFPGLDRRLQWHGRLGPAGVARYMLFRTVWWTLLRACGIRRQRRPLDQSQPPVPGGGQRERSG